MVAPLAIGEPGVIRARSFSSQAQTSASAGRPAGRPVAV
jgi:hypothetical protein